MSNKQFINWGKWASIITVVAALMAFAAWGWDKAFSASLGNLPDKVQTDTNLLQGTRKPIDGTRQTVLSL